MTTKKRKHEKYDRSFKFNKRNIENLPPHDPSSRSTEMEYSDIECRGLKVSVSKNGRKFFLHRYRMQRGNRSIRRCYRLGEFGPFSVQDGRDFVNENKRLIAQSIDPLEEKQKISKNLTFSEFFENEYMPNYAMKVKKSWRHDQWMYNSDVKNAMGGCMLNEISRHDISKFIYTIKDRTSGARANRFLSLISKVFSTALDWEFLAGDNPCRRIKKFKESSGRTRYLSNNEIKRLKIALDAVPKRQRVSALAIWFLLATGCRLGEAMSLTWDRIEIENNLAFLPKEMTKNATAHQIYLNKQAIKTLTELKKYKVRGNPHLFPGVGSKNLVSPRRTFDNVKKAAKLDNLRLHDLRHSFCSIVISNNNNSLYTLSKLLGHANQAMTSRYSHLRNQALVDASETVAAELESVME